MAVVQISKIQVRRGRKLAGTSLPQLASGEFGWAVDSQELYIGNGSVSEGAPYVGNTQILTEHTNILDLPLQYQYKRDDTTIQTGESSAQPVQRSLQSRLDDIVSAHSFGVVGNGIDDDTLALQRAIDQLYLRDIGAVNNRVILMLDAGVYVISDALLIPPYVTLQGAGKDKTIIRQTSNQPVFLTIALNGIGENPSNLNQARYINVSGMTLQQTVAEAPILTAYCMRNSTFTNVKFEGAWSYGSTLIDSSIGIDLQAFSPIVTCENNIFDNCEITGVSYAIDSTYDINSNLFDNMLIKYCGTGVIFGYDITGVGGKQYGPKNNKVTNTKFIDIQTLGYNVVAGRGNMSKSNTYINVGLDGADESTAVFPIINFGQAGNNSENDFFNRSVELSSNPLYIVDKPFVNEVSGYARSEHKYNNEIFMSTTSTGEFIPLFKLPATSSSSYVVHYVYSSTANRVHRQGKMYINVDRLNDLVHFTDDSSTVGTTSNIEKLIFMATLEDANIDTVKDTVYIHYTNPVTSEDGYINYWYETLS